MQGLVPGTTVRVTANGNPVAQGKATSQDQTFTLKRTLPAGEVVRGKQDFATEGSDITPNGVRVLRKPAGPSELSPVRLVSLAVISLLAFVPFATAERSLGPRDSQMRRVVAKFQAASAAASRQFRVDLRASVAKCARKCDPESLFQALVKNTTLAEQRLSSALKTADRQLGERAHSVQGASLVPGMAGDLTRSVARLEMISLTAATEMSVSLASMKGPNFGGAPLLTSLQLQFVSLVYKTPIGLGVTLTFHTAGAPTAFLHMDGTAPADAAVTITITCGGSPQEIHLVASEDGTWGFSTTVTFSGATMVCTVTATAGSGISAGSFTKDVFFQ